MRELWPTGLLVNDEKSVVNLKRASNLSNLLWKNKIKGKSPLIQPRTGVAELHKQIDLIKNLYRHGIDISSVQLDAASRRNYFSHAQKGFENSVHSKESFLNGFPVPIHGVEGVNKLVNSLPIPFQIRGGAPDHRFTYEIALAGGATGLEGGFICYLFPYEKEISPYDSYLYWQYIDMLTGKFLKENNILINREFFGPLTSTLIEPCIPIVINIVQTIMAASNGVKSISVGYAEQGNRWQDIAAINIMEQLVNFYLRKYGYLNCQITTVYHQYMAAFPKCEIKSEDLIIESSITAALSGATKVMTKTPVESIKIPSAEDNIRGIELTKKGFLKSFNSIIERTEIEKEVALIKKEVISIMNVIEELGNNNLAKGIIKAFEKGFLDIPFSPNKYNMGKVITLRGIDGAIRFADCGNLPFDESVKEFHYEELSKRVVTERENRVSKLIEKDLIRITKGDYKSWPLNKAYIN
ncbi:MAG: methylaspartate mutase subunit E [Bacteroidetes bacterium GWE2_32_14]|nr:MAG: methylaspartate mutase subunit E [Bacteroidetes bacterium GWE2_32_14]